MVKEFSGIDKPWARWLETAYRLAHKVDVARKKTRPKIAAPIPVISVGNITVGGSGKTPMVRYLAECLRGMGKNPVILSRGYGGTEQGPTRVPLHGASDQFGDEAVMLAQSGLTVWVAKKRELGVAPACADGDILILEDGFQRRQIHRDLDLVLFGPLGIGNGHLLPAGILREPLSALGQADAMCGLATALPNLYPEMPRFEFGYLDYEYLPYKPEPDTACAAMAGIAHPSTFFAALQRDNIRVESTYPLPDHDPLKPKAIAQIAAVCKDKGIEAVIVTEKDAVKLPATIGGLEVIVAKANWGPMNKETHESFQRFLRQRIGL